MSDARLGAVLHQIRHLFAAGSASGLTEWQLLHRYTARRDEAAFAAIVARHGPMVLGVCRRVLDRPEDVEDAFQATFLVLMRKAGGLHERGALGTWLYQVALRVSMRARSASAKRRVKERKAKAAGDEATANAVFDPETDPDLGPMLDEELSRLPATYREAVVLCYLEGLSHEQAARQLGWPIGTVKGRLSRARELLRGRLTRRGVTLTAAALVAGLGRAAKASGPVPLPMVRTAVRAASRVSTGQAATGAVSASAASLAEGVAWSLTVSQWASAGAAAAVVVALAAGVGSLGLRTGGVGPDRPPGTFAAAFGPTLPAPPDGAEAAAVEPQDQAPRDPDDAEIRRLRAEIEQLRQRIDEIYNSSKNPSEPALLQLHDLVKIKQTRLAQLKGGARDASEATKPDAPKPEPTQAVVESNPSPPDPRAVAREGFRLALRHYQNGVLTLDAVQAWADRLYRSETQLANGRPAEEAAAARDHLERMRRVEAVAKRKREPVGRPGASLEWLAARFDRELAEQNLARHQAKAPAATLKADRIDVVGPGAVGVSVEKPGETPAAPVVVETPDATIQADRLAVSGHVRVTQKPGTVPGQVQPGGQGRDIVVHSAGSTAPDPTAAELTTRPGAAGRGSGKAQGRSQGRDARSQAVLRALDQPVPMAFPNETPLGDVLAHIKQATRSAEFPRGLPVYVDPVGLQEAEKSLSSPIMMDLEGVPLGRTLHLALKQLGLSYRVVDGFVYVSSESSEDVGPLPPPTREPSPLMSIQERAERGELTNPAERQAIITMLKDAALIERLITDEQFKQDVVNSAVGRGATGTTIKGAVGGSIGGGVKAIQ